MKFLPFENLGYKTKLNEDEILRRLRENIEPVQELRYTMLRAGTEKKYEGQITGHCFEMSRIIRRKNPFSPKIKGVITSGVDGTSVRVKMRFNVLVYVFLCFWLADVGYASFKIFKTAMEKPGFDPGILFPFVLLVFLYCLIMPGFKSESKKNKEDLKTMFEPYLVEQ